jgi:hypothetical protein
MFLFGGGGFDISTVQHFRKTSLLEHNSPLDITHYPENGNDTYQDNKTGRH